jgi:hypothetical protein
MSDHLTYFIADRLLVGDVSGIHFQESAVSGGGAGRKDASGRTLPPADPSLANNVWRTDKAGVVDTDDFGGPIPCGKYAVAASVSKGLWMDLSPAASIPIIDSGARKGFAIHGRGKWGSYGCIVVLNGAKLHVLYNAVRSSQGVTLDVIAGALDMLTSV